MARGKGEGSITEIKKSGKPIVYQARFTTGYDGSGKQKRQVKYCKTRQEAKDWLTEQKAARDKGEYIEPSKMTVAQWMDEWLEVYKKRSVRATSFALLRENVRLYIKPMLGEHMLKNLNKEMVQKFINELTDREYSYHTITKAYSVLHQALDQAVDSGHIKSNVSQKVTLPENNTNEKRALTLEEQKILIEEAKKSRHGEAFILALYTGLRRGELLGLTWNDIDFEEETLTVNQSRKEYYISENASRKVVAEYSTPKTKTSKRTIPLAPYIVDMLKAKKEYDKLRGGNETELIFHLNGEPVTFSCLTASLCRIRRRTGLGVLGVHCLRHTFATRCLESGIDMRVVQSFLGHSSIKMTADLYTHVLPAKKKEDIMKLPEF